jgi:predicted transcriptional regulator
MAMTLRLDDELDRRLEQLADGLGLSKQQLVARAVREFLTREQRIVRTVANADRVVQENAGLLDRLAQ